MIFDNDKVLIGVSGQDSMALAKVHISLMPYKCLFGKTTNRILMQKIIETARYEIK